MNKPTSAEFIQYALTHVHTNTFPCGVDEHCLVNCTSLGSDPWEYLYGTTGQAVTQSVLDERFNHFYEPHGWSNEAFRVATDGWIELGRRVCDAQGLLNSFLGTDVTPNYNYNAWCTDAGPMNEIKRDWRIGEAVFHCDDISKRMTHVGFVCGYLDDEPLIVEARGIRFGVCVTRLSERPWTHRGLITAYFDYDYLSIEINTDAIECRELNPATDWISITASPKSSGIYLVWRNHFYGGEVGEYAICYFDGDTWYDAYGIDYNRELNVTDISHWMQLPDKPIM